MTSNLLRPLAFAVLGLVLPIAPAAAQTAAPANKVATVNGVAIPKSRINVIVKAQAARGQADSDELRNQIREQLIVREIVTQEATKKGLAKGTDVQAQIDLARQNVLWQAYIADFVKANPVTDAQVKAEYEKLKSSRGDKEYKVRHILVDKEEDAKAIIADLKKGKKFEELAKQSKDPGSKDRGGDLDWNSPGGVCEAVLRRDGQARERQIHRHAGAIAVRLARHHARRRARSEISFDGRSEAADYRTAARAGVLEERLGSAGEGEGRAVAGVTRPKRARS